MGFEWDDTLSTGIEEIDRQHKELIARINQLMDAITGKQDKEAVAGYLTFLREYVAYHFAAEERDMTEYTYPGLIAHEAEHEQFKKRVNQLYDSFLARGATDQILVAAIRSSGEWLVNHIHKTDKTMAAFLIKQTKT